MKTKVKEKRSERIEIRCTQKEKNRIKGLARLYAMGNVSVWILETVLESDRRVVKPTK